LKRTSGRRRISEKHEAHHRALLEQLGKKHAEAVTQLQQESQEAAKISPPGIREMAKLDADFQSGWQSLETDWKNSAFRCSIKFMQPMPKRKNFSSNGSRRDGKMEAATGFQECRAICPARS